MCIHVYVSMYTYTYVCICIYGPTYSFFGKCRGGRESYLCFYCVVSIQIRCIVVILRLNSKCGTITSVPVCPSF